MHDENFCIHFMPLWGIYFSPTLALPDLPGPVQMFLWKFTPFPLLVSLFYLSYSKTLYTLHYYSLSYGLVAIYDSSLTLCADCGPGEHLWAKALFVLHWERGVRLEEVSINLSRQVLDNESVCSMGTIRFLLYPIQSWNQGWGRKPRQ